LEEIVPWKDMQCESSFSVVPARSELEEFEGMWNLKVRQVEKHSSETPVILHRISIS
jgi:hypothetical protein